MILKTLSDINIRSTEPRIDLSNDLIYNRALELASVIQNLYQHIYEGEPLADTIRGFYTAINQLDPSQRLNLINIISNESLGFALFSSQLNKRVLNWPNNSQLFGAHNTHYNSHSQFLNKTKAQRPLSIDYCEDKTENNENLLFSKTNKKIHFEVENCPQKGRLFHSHQKNSLWKSTQYDNSTTKYKNWPRYLINSAMPLLKLKQVLGVISTNLLKKEFSQEMIELILEKVYQSINYGKIKCNFRANAEDTITTWSQIRIIGNRRINVSEDVMGIVKAIRAALMYLTLKDKELRIELVKREKSNSHTTDNIIEKGESYIENLERELTNQDGCDKSFYNELKACFNQEVIERILAEFTLNIPVNFKNKDLIKSSLKGPPQTPQLSSEMKHFRQFPETFECSFTDKSFIKEEDYTYTLFCNSGFNISITVYNNSNNGPAILAPYGLIICNFFAKDLRKILQGKLKKKLEPGLYIPRELITDVEEMANGYIKFKLLVPTGTHPKTGYVFKGWQKSCIEHFHTLSNYLMGPHTTLEELNNTKFDLHEEAGPNGCPREYNYCKAFIEVAAHRGNLEKRVQLDPFAEYFPVGARAIRHHPSFPRTIFEDETGYKVVDFEGLPDIGEGLVIIPKTIKGLCGSITYGYPYHFTFLIGLLLGKNNKAINGLFTNVADRRGPNADPKEIDNNTPSLHPVFFRDAAEFMRLKATEFPQSDWTVQKVTTYF